MNEPELYRGQGELLLGQTLPAPDEAEACFRRIRPLAARCHLGLGTLYRRTGDRAKADEHLATATALYREMDMGFWLEKAEAVLSEMV